MVRRLGPGLRTSGRYSFGTTRTFDEQLSLEDQSRIDRIFPQVRLSAVAGAIARDTRDDVLDPERGTFVSGEGTVAARSIGGQVGFIKTYLQGFWFRRLPAQKRIVFASRVAVGLADGFSRTVTSVDQEGQPVTLTVEDLPASERFFAGGDTTIRGFADGGNVFDRVTEFDFGELRGSSGFGLRYRSPIGPIRFDIGFKMDRRVLGAELEKRPALHFSIGQAF